LHLREPHRPAKAVLILYAVIHDREALILKQLAVLGGIEARMVKRLSFQLPDDLSVRWSGGKHKRGSWRGMIPKRWKHPSLIAVVQMKETVPRKNAMEGLRKTERPHICHQCTLFG
jgi:hypothetical protein